MKSGWAKATFAGTFRVSSLGCLVTEMTVRLMRVVTRIWIDGAFVTPHGTEMLNLFDAVHGEEIGQDRLAGAEHARRTIQSAERALLTDARTGNSERLEQLSILHEAAK